MNTNKSVYILLLMLALFGCIKKEKPDSPQPERRYMVEFYSDSGQKLETFYCDTYRQEVKMFGSIENYVFECYEWEWNPYHGVWNHHYDVWRQKERPMKNCKIIRQ